MLRGWIQSKSANASTHSLDTLAEPQHLETALRAAAHIMNDDLESAEAGLANGTSAFHKLAKGMVAFLRATLGFEPEIMREAAERLADAETTASTDNRRAQKDGHSFRSAIYPPGAEFALCHAQTQLMSAVIGVLNESLTESIKGFYKLRKAYVTLEGILDAEARYMRNRSGMGTNAPSRTSMESLGSDRSAPSMKGMPGGFGGAASKPPSIRSFRQPVTNYSNGAAEKQDGLTNDAQDDSDEGEFYDADDGTTANLDNLSLDGEGNAKDLPGPRIPAAKHGIIDHDPDSDVFANSPQ